MALIDTVSDYDRLAHIYDRWVSGDPASEECLRFYLDWGKSCEDTIVELGVGTGRIALALAKAGKRVVGVDCSSAMLQRCRQKAEQAQVGDRIRLVKADIRAFDLGLQSKLIIFPMRSIGHLLSQDDRRAMLHRVYQHLAPGGLFIFDHYVFDEAWARTHDGIPRLLYASPNPETEGVYIWDTYVYDFMLSRMRCHVTEERTDATGTVLLRRHYSFYFSWIYPKQMRQIADETGFEVMQVLGSFSGAPFNDESSDQIWLLRRRV